MSAELSDAIASMADVPIVTRWVLVAEVVDENGEQALQTLHSPGLSQWDAVGMYTYAATKAGEG